MKAKSIHSVAEKLSFNMVGGRLVASCRMGF